MLETMAANKIKQEQTLRLPPHPNAAVHQRIMEDLRKMTPEEFLQSLIEAGICTPDGELAPYYRGESDEMPIPESMVRAGFAK
jgi:hypothetical protein